MEKSLGWLKIRGKKSKRECSKTITNSTSNKRAKMSFTETQYYEEEDQKTVESDYCCHQHHVIAAPSMCSSFDTSQACLMQHSTPCSLSRLFSPIIRKEALYYSKSEAKCSSYSPSSLSSSSSSRSSCESSGSGPLSRLHRRRLSFGATTSSPVSSSSALNWRPDDEEEFEATPIRYLEHINKIKKNIKLEVEMRTLRCDIFDPIDTKLCDRDLQLQEQYHHNHQLHNAEKLIPTSKKRKLQHIFRVKLRKQLKEIRKWQIGVTAINPKCEVESSLMTATIKNNKFVHTAVDCNCYECNHYYRELIESNYSVVRD